MFGGVLILKGFGISFGALRIAGGLTVALLGYRMLFQSADTFSASGRAGQHIAFFPLAMPGISGPGAIAVVIGISTEIAELKIGMREAAAYFATVASILLTCILIWCTLRFAQLFSRWMGQEGMDALNRLMGFVMICIGVQFVGSGVRTFMLGGPKTRRNNPRNWCVAASTLFFIFPAGVHKELSSQLAPGPEIHRIGHGSSGKVGRT
ncbi:MarC family protein [Undibacterium arcticum]